MWGGGLWGAGVGYLGGDPKAEVDLCEGCRGYLGTQIGYLGL